MLGAQGTKGQAWCPRKYPHPPEQDFGLVDGKVLDSASSEGFVFNKMERCCELCLLLCAGGCNRGH